MSNKILPVLLFFGLVFQSCEDDVPTQPELAAKTFQVAENSPDGTLIGSVPDALEAKTSFQYTLVGGDPENAFDIDAVAGTITVADVSILDYEKVNAFELAVEVFNKKTKLYGTVIINVEVTNVMEIPQNGLVASYYFTNGRFNDSTGNGNTATNFNTTPSPDRFGESTAATYFNSVDDVVKVNNPSFLNNNAGTLAAWVKFDAVDHTQYIASVGDEGSIESYLSLIRLDGTKKVLSIYQREIGLANWVEGSTVIVPNKYYFLVMSSDGEKWTLYIDGNKEALTVRQGINSGKWIGALAGIDNFTMGSLVIQQPFTVPNFSGTLDDVLLYNRVLEKCEIDALYADSMPQ